MSVNQDRFDGAWGATPPRWVQLLHAACSKMTQREVAERLGKSSGYVSRVLYKNYAGSMEEAEQLVLESFGGDTVRCPIWSSTIPLSACRRNRRRKGLPRNEMQRTYALHCPDCPNNLDREDA